MNPVFSDEYFTALSGKPNHRCLIPALFRLSPPISRRWHGWADYLKPVDPAEGGDYNRLNFVCQEQMKHRLKSAILDRGASLGKAVSTDQGVCYWELTEGQPGKNELKFWYAVDILRLNNATKHFAAT